MNILIIDNNIDADCWGSPDLRRYAGQVSGATVHIRRGPQDDLPGDPRAFDKIVVSGSRTSALEDAPWISALHDFIGRTLDSGRPYLGVCYGHQSLVRVLAGKRSLRRGEVPELGWTKIDVLGQSPLLEGLPGSFYSYSSHYEEVAELPREMRLLARSEACGVQACQLADRPVFGVQFHPERNLEEATRTLREKKKKGQEPLLHPDRGHELYDPEVGARIFGNFFKL